MRYSSSRTTASAAPSPTPAHVSSTGNLHYKKDGTLDMRYSSSQNTSVPTNAPSSARPGPLHVKKDGTLDMRYSSSQAAVAQKTVSSSSGHTTLHLKKDGTLDMRYSSSKAVAKAAVSGRAGEGGLHYKKDGTLDMRYNSSKMADEVQRAMASMNVSSDGARSVEGGDNGQSAREAYYESLAEQNELYRQLLKQFSEREEVPCQSTAVLPSSDDIAAYLKAYSLSSCPPATSANACHPAADASSMESVTSALPSSILQLTQADVETAIVSREEIGRGAFGLVYRGVWQTQKVAVKVLFLTQLQRAEKAAFEKELIILGHLGTHPNLVQLLGYSIEMPAFVMELVALGSLHHSLYFNNDETVTAALSTSATKKKILIGVLSGLVQLHHVGIVHGDLKPHNVLLTHDFVAKITDFGLSRLRAKASSLTASSQEESAPIVAGTSAYMAPELLEGSTQASPATDIYSMGILFNELCVEEDPYSEHYRSFLGKGPYASTLFAKEGNRPRQDTSSGAQLCNALIRRCWHADATQRPTAVVLLESAMSEDCVLPSLSAASMVV